MPAFIIIPLQIIVGYTVAKVAAAAGDVVIDVTTSSYKATKLKVTEKLANMERRTAEAKMAAEEAKSQAGLNPEDVSDDDFSEAA